MNKKVAIATISALVIITLGFAGITMAEAKKNPINIGCTAGLTGPGALQFLRAVELLKGIVEDLNAAGGINGRPIELFVADDGSEPSRAVGNLKKFSQQNKCVAIYAANISTVQLAAKLWAEQKHIPVMGVGASDKLLDEKGKSWWFMAVPPTGLCIEAAFPRIKKLGFTKVGFEGTALAWGTDGLATVKKFVPKYGFEFAGAILCEPKSKDLTIQARELRDKGAEAVLQIEYAPEMCVWARALNDIDWHPLVISPVAHHISDTLEICPKELLDGWEGVAWGDFTKPLAREVLDKYEKYSGKRLEAQDLYFNWDGFQVLLEAIRISGNPDDPEAIRDALYKVKDFKTALGRKGAIGSFEIGRNHLMSSPEDLVIKKVKSGKLQDIE